MGGNAFKTLPAFAFPRIPPVVYLPLKQRLKSKLSELYSLVSVPIEAPEKSDYGDIDFLVTHPHPRSENVTPKDIQTALGATHAILMDGNRTSNFAIPIRHGAWREFNCETLEAMYRDRLSQPSVDVDGGTIEQTDQLFYQVDVHVCNDEAEWKRIGFFNSHGDMGMILGLLMRNHGLQLGSKGLKLPNPPNPAFELSNDFNEILQFMGLSAEAPRSAFTTRQELFEWLGSSRLFNPNNFRYSGSGISKVKSERTMYHDFTRWAEGQRRSYGVRRVQKTTQDHGAQVTTFHTEALEFFNKKQAFEAASQARMVRVALKRVWCGHQVRDWTDLGEYWKGVKLIMDGVRAEYGGDDKIAELLERDGGEALLKKKVLEVRDRLGLVPR